MSLEKVLGFEMEHAMKRVKRTTAKKEFEPKNHQKKTTANVAVSPPPPENDYKQRIGFNNLIRQDLLERL